MPSAAKIRAAVSGAAYQYGLLRNRRGLGKFISSAIGGGGGIANPVMSSVTVDVDGYVIVTVTDTYSDRWQFYRDGNPIGAVLSAVPSSLSISQLASGESATFRVRGWRDVDGSGVYRESTAVTLSLVENIVIDPPSITAATVDSNRYVLLTVVDTYSNRWDVYQDNVQIGSTQTSVPTALSVAQLAFGATSAFKVRGWRAVDGSGVYRTSNIVTLSVAPSVIDPPVITSATLDVAGNVVISVTDTYSDRWQVYQDGGAIGSVLTTVPAGLAVAQLAPGATGTFSIRGWRNVDGPGVYRTSNAVTLTREQDINPPVITSATVDASGYAILTVLDTYSDRWQVYQDGATVGGVLTTVPSALSVVQLSSGQTSIFYVRGWRNVDGSGAFRSSGSVTLTREASVATGLIHNFNSGDDAPSTGQTMSYTRNAVSWAMNGGNGWGQVKANNPIWVGGIEAQYSNLFPSSGAPVTQAITLYAGQYVLAITGSGSIVAAGVTVTEAGGAKIVDVRPLNTDTESVTFTVAGSVTTALLYRGSDITTVLPYIADTAPTAKVLRVGDRARVLHMPAQAPVVGVYGMKPTTAFVNLSTYNRATSTEFGPDGSAMYAIVSNNTALVQHGATNLRSGQVAGTYFCDVWVSVLSQHGIAFGIQDGGGGSTFCFVNPTTGAINAQQVANGTPNITGWSVENVGLEGDSYHYRLKFTNPSTQSLTMLTYTTAFLTDSTYASLTYTGSSAKASWVWGGFWNKDFPLNTAVMLGQGTCPADVFSYTIDSSAWSSTATAIKLRVRARRLGELLTTRYLCGWTNGGIRIKTDNKIEIIVGGSAVLTTSWVVDPGKDFSIHVRLKSGDFAIAVDNRPVETSSTVAALPSVTTFYLGSDAAGANQLHGSSDTLELRPGEVDNATLVLWPRQQATNGTLDGPSSPSTTNKWRKANNGLWVREALALSGATGSQVYDHLATVKSWNSNNGFAGIKGINLFWALKNIRPTVDTYTWTDLDNCLDRIQSYGMKCLVHIMETNFAQPISDLGGSYATNYRYRSSFFGPYMLVWNRYYHSYMAGLPSSDPYYNREEVRMEDWDNSLKYVYEAYVQMCARYRQHAAFAGICGTETTKLGLRDTTTPAGISSGYVRKGLEMDNLRKWRGDLAALYPDLVIGAYQSFSRDGATSTASLIQHLNGLGNGYEGWPDSRISWLQEQPATSAYWYESADYSPGKLADTCLIFPGTQAGISQFTLAEMQTIWSLANARFNCHGICTDFKSGGGKSTQQYHEQVTLAIASTINSQCNQTNPFGSG
jgi:hypothetical protein